MIVFKLAHQLIAECIGMSVLIDWDSNWNPATLFADNKAKNRVRPWSAFVSMSRPGL